MRERERELKKSRPPPYLGTGMTVVSVDYRTYLHHEDKSIEIGQFPAGLNDCYSGLEWLHEHKEELGCETVVNFG